MKEIIEAADKVLDTVDDNIYSRSEWETDRTSRHLADKQSDNPLAKMIRPIAFIWAMVVCTFLWIGSIWFNIPEAVTSAANSVLISIIGFYFVSRGAEKVFSKRSAADIQINKMKVRHELREQRRQNRKSK